MFGSIHVLLYKIVSKFAIIHSDDIFHMALVNLSCNTHPVSCATQREVIQHTSQR